MCRYTDPGNAEVSTILKSKLRDEFSEANYADALIQSANLLFIKPAAPGS